MKKLNEAVEHAQSDYETRNGEAARKFRDVLVFQGVAVPDLLPQPPQPQPQPPQIGAAAAAVAIEGEKVVHGTAVVFEANPLPVGATWKPTDPRDFGQIFRPRVSDFPAAPVFYGSSSFVLPADATWKVMHHPGPYLNPPVEEGSSDEESGESVITGTSSDSEDEEDKNT